MKRTQREGAPANKTKKRKKELPQPELNEKPQVTHSLGDEHPADQDDQMDVDELQAKPETPRSNVENEATTDVNRILRLIGHENPLFVAKGCRLLKNKKIIEEILRFTPKVSELLDWFKDDRESAGIEGLQKLRWIGVHAEILLALSNIVTYGNRLVKDHISRWVLSDIKLFYTLLALQNQKFRIAVLSLFIAIVHQSTAIATEFSQKFNFSYEKFANLALHQVQAGKPPKADAKSVRHYYLSFIESLLKTSNYEIINKCISHSALLPLAVKEMQFDNASEQKALLQAIDQSVASKMISHPIRSSFLGGTLLDQVTSIIVNEEYEEPMISYCADLVIKWAKNSIVYEHNEHRWNRPVHSKAHNRPLVKAVSYLSPPKSIHSLRVIVQILKMAPDIAIPYLSTTHKLVADPVLSISFITNINLIAQIIKLSVPPYSTVTDINQFILLMTQTLMPKMVNKKMLTVGMQHSSPLVRFHVALLMISIVESLRGVIDEIDRHIEAQKTGSGAHRHDTDLSTLQQMRKRLLNDIRGKLPDIQVIMGSIKKEDLSSHLLLLERLIYLIRIYLTVYSSVIQESRLTPGPFVSFLTPGTSSVEDEVVDRKIQDNLLDLVKSQIIELIGILPLQSLNVDNIKTLISVMLDSSETIREKMKNLILNFLFAEGLIDISEANDGRDFWFFHEIPIECIDEYVIFIKNAISMKFQYFDLLQLVYQDPLLAREKTRLNVMQAAAAVAIMKTKGETFSNFLSRALLFGEISGRPHNARASQRLIVRCHLFSGSPSSLPYWVKLLFEFFRIPTNIVPLENCRDKFQLCKSLKGTNDTEEEEEEEEEELNRYVDSNNEDHHRNGLLHKQMLALLACVANASAIPSVDDHIVDQLTTNGPHRSLLLRSLLFVLWHDANNGWVDRRRTNSTLKLLLKLLNLGHCESNSHLVLQYLFDNDFSVRFSSSTLPPYVSSSYYFGVFICIVMKNIPIAESVKRYLQSILEFYNTLHNSKNNESNPNKSEDNSRASNAAERSLVKQRNTIYDYFINPIVLSFPALFLFDQFISCLNLSIPNSIANDKSAINKSHQKELVIPVPAHPKYYGLLIASLMKKYDLWQVVASYSFDEEYHKFLKSLEKHLIDCLYSHYKRAFSIGEATDTTADIGCIVIERMVNDSDASNMALNNIFYPNYSNLSWASLLSIHLLICNISYTSITITLSPNQPITHLLAFIQSRRFVRNAAFDTEILELTDKVISNDAIGVDKTSRNLSFALGVEIERLVRYSKLHAQEKSPARQQQKKKIRFAVEKSKEENDPKEIDDDKEETIENSLNEEDWKLEKKIVSMILAKGVLDGEEVEIVISILAHLMEEEYQREFAKSKRDLVIGRVMRSLVKLFRNPQNPNSETDRLLSVMQMLIDLKWMPVSSDKTDKVVLPFLISCYSHVYENHVTSSEKVAFHLLATMKNLAQRIGALLLSRETNELCRRLVGVLLPSSDTETLSLYRIKSILLLIQTTPHIVSNDKDSDKIDMLMDNLLRVYSATNSRLDRTRLNLMSSLETLFGKSMMKYGGLYGKHIPEIKNESPYYYYELSTSLLINGELVLASMVHNTISTNYVNNRFVDDIVQLVGGYSLNEEKTLFVNPKPASCCYNVLVSNSSIIDDSDVYDIRFVLPLISHLMNINTSYEKIKIRDSDSNTDMVNDDNELVEDGTAKEIRQKMKNFIDGLVNSNALSVALYALSSSHTLVRRIASDILEKFVNLSVRFHPSLKKAKSEAENDAQQKNDGNSLNRAHYHFFDISHSSASVVALIGLLKDSIEKTDTEEGDKDEKEEEEGIGNKNSITTANIKEIPACIAAFFAHSVNKLTQAQDRLFRYLNNFLVHHHVLNFDWIPLLDVTFVIGSNTSNEAMRSNSKISNKAIGDKTLIQWLVGLLPLYIRNYKDYKLMKKWKVLDLAMSYHDNMMSPDTPANPTTLAKAFIVDEPKERKSFRKLFFLATKIKRAAFDVIENGELIVWLHSILGRDYISESLIHDVTAIVNNILDSTSHPIANHSVSKSFKNGFRGLVPVFNRLVEIGREYGCWRLNEYGVKVTSCLVTFLNHRYNDTFLAPAQFMKIVEITKSTTHHSPSENRLNLDHLLLSLFYINMKAMEKKVDRLIARDKYTNLIQFDQWKSVIEWGLDRILEHIHISEKVDEHYFRERVVFPFIIPAALIGTSTAEFLPFPLVSLSVINYHRGLFPCQMVKWLATVVFNQMEEKLKETVFCGELKGHWLALRTRCGFLLPVFATTHGSTFNKYVLKLLDDLDGYTYMEEIGKWNTKITFNAETS